ncbi:MAG: hypothetical protein SFU56_12380 [Capsulimonadales bacterium]|nr:hypothetical protein [Capsulimonadales bacterium]
MTGKCPSCGAQTARGAKFCSLCGTAIPSATLSSPANAAPSVMPGGVPPRPNPTATPGAYTPPVTSAGPRRANVLAILGGATALALILFLLLKASGVLGAKKAEVPTAGVLSAPQTRVAEAPVMNAPPVKQPEAPVLAPPEVKGNPMPEDVIAYLRWLKKFEAARRSLEYRGNAAYLKLPTMLTMKMMAHFDENNDQGQQNQGMTADVAAEIGRIVQELNAATGKFQAYPPPNPCAALAETYNMSLATKVRQLGKMQVAVSEIFRMFDAEGNTNESAQQMLPQLLQEMTTRAMSQEADAADLAADQALNAVRAQYTDIPEDIDDRHFDIKQVDLKIDPRSVIPPGMGMGFGL